MQLFERLWLLIHQVDDESEAAVEEGVKYSTVLHQRSRYVLEEVPHALTDGRLVIDQLAKAGQSLIRARGADVVESDQDGLLENLLQLGVHFWEAAGE